MFKNIGYVAIPYEHRIRKNHVYDEEAREIVVVPLEKNDPRRLIEQMIILPTKFLNNAK
ncbi:MAG: hypothetical protein Q9M91_06050 [Candidatus Dojkabacteria bacterium]|nr:hypothetical protein [Candidatus Dojkabacteria bacterium]